MPELTPARRETVPTPDPTSLTTQNLQREVAMAREILGVRIKCIEELLERVEKTLDRRAPEIELHVSNLKALHEEKFRSIATQFTERDTRTEQTSRDSKVAVDAALQAAKEAVGEQNKSSALAIAKSEAATTKQIDQIAILISTSNKATDDKIEDLKARLDRGDGKIVGQAYKDSSGDKMSSFIFSIIAAVFSLIGIGIATLAIFLR